MEPANRRDRDRLVPIIKVFLAKLFSSANRFLLQILIACKSDWFLMLVLSFVHANILNEAASLSYVAWHESSVCRYQWINKIHHPTWTGWISTFPTRIFYPNVSSMVTGSESEQRWFIVASDSRMKSNLQRKECDAGKCSGRVIASLVTAVHN